jgi:hypothetical protein
MTAQEAASATWADADADEARARLRGAFNHIDRAIAALERVEAIHAGTPETTLARRRLQEGRFWLIEHGHGSWVEE